ncbi:GNAT family N-acetyltransferase [Glycomyces harbinensis]|uniref:Acetyltransferase (GNAT) family protein n=1 Tax=Glycomyces harbinensis TaxID=58114 RepID=A0A1G6UR59_9ACTN|nr:GNAT family N-acetyltransferase [Glycomyces harbinensis]SDD43781.1 Acetyltransferase (GNAT) family protein [Glycomyces harbinensis]
MSAPELEILPIDPLDQALVDDWIGLQHTVARHDRPGDPLPSPALARLSLLMSGEYHRTERYVARAAGAVVAALGLETALQDNRHLVEVKLEVHPDHRRAGVGTALLAFTERRTAELGRGTILGSAHEDVEGGPAWDRSGRDFANARGYTVVDRDVHGRCDLALVGDDELDKLYAEAWNRAAGYELLQCAEPAVSDDLVAGIAYLCERMYTDMPIAEALDLRPADVDTARIREYERSRVRLGQRQFISAVRHIETGVVAGYTFIWVDPGEDEHAWQDDTIVLPEHRGRRLGTILKIANHRLLREHRPRMRYVHTWNAEVNGPMLDINTAVGYRPHGRDLIVQKKLA